MPKPNFCHTVWSFSCFLPQILLEGALTVVPQCLAQDRAHSSCSVNACLTRELLRLFCLSRGLEVTASPPHCCPGSRHRKEDWPAPQRSHRAVGGRALPTRQTGACGKFSQGGWGSHQLSHCWWWPDLLLGVPKRSSFHWPHQPSGRGRDGEGGCLRSPASWQGCQPLILASGVWNIFVSPAEKVLKSHLVYTPMWVGLPGEVDLPPHFPLGPECGTASWPGHPPLAVKLPFWREALWVVIIMQVVPSPNRPRFALLKRSLFHIPWKPQNQAKAPSCLLQASEPRPGWWNPRLFPAVSSE